MNVIGFRDGNQVAAQSITPMPQTKSANTTINLSSDFDSVDEIRLLKDQSDWIAGGYPGFMDIIINQIVLNEAAAANSGFTLTVGNGAYTEDNGSTVIDPSASASDADGDADWDCSASLTVQITADNEAADEISFSISAPNLLHSGTQIGTISESSGTPNDGTVTNNGLISINFGSNASNAIVSSLVQSIAYLRTSDSPTAGASTRTVTVTLTDKNSASINDTATITISAGKSVAEDRLSFSTSGTVALADSSAGANASVSGTVIGTLANTIAANDGFTQADIDSGDLTYAHNGGETSSDNFTFSLADGGENGSLLLTSQMFNISVAGVNDAPVITGQIDVDTYKNQPSALRLSCRYPTVPWMKIAPTIGGCVILIVMGPNGLGRK